MVPPSWVPRVYQSAQKNLDTSLDEAIQSGIMTRSKCRKMPSTIQRKGLMAILCYRFFDSSNHHSDRKSLKEKYDTGYNLGFSFVFNPIFIGIFDFI